MLNTFGTEWLVLCLTPFATIKQSHRDKGLVTFLLSFGTEKKNSHDKVHDENSQVLLSECSFEDAKY